MDRRHSVDQQQQTCFCRLFVCKTVTTNTQQFNKSSFVCLLHCFALLWSPAPVIARARLPLYFTAVSYFFYFLSPHFLRRRKTDIPGTFPHDVVFNRTFAIAIFSKFLLKRTGAEKPKICTIFLAKSQTISTVVR